MSNEHDVKIVMDISVDGKGSIDHLNNQRNKFNQQVNEVLQMFDYAIDNNEDWKSIYYGE
tara:strand:+ start:295 stop:474 length:180 start_codon:yes stop_codon:yes gene_type:complete